MRRFVMFALTFFLAGCATVNPGEAGILYRPYSPSAAPEVLGRGTYSKAPWNDLVVYDLRWRTSLEKVDVQTKDKLHLVVPAAVVYRLKLKRLVEIHQSLGPSFYESTVRPAILTALRTEFARRTHDEVVPKAAQLQKDILVDLRQQLALYGIDLRSVTFRDLDYPPELAKTILKRMTILQQTKNKEAELALVRRQQAITLAKRRGEAESRLGAKETEEAIAVKDATVLLTRTRAEAEAVRLRAAQLSPGYLRLRAIEALEAFAESPNSKIYFLPTGKDGVPLALHADVDR